MENRVLGDYKLLKEIGRGSLGTVYLAEHRFMKKQYVLKVLPEELSADRGFMERFEREVSLLASLDHPHIVKIHNVSYADGSYFLVVGCIVDSYRETTNLSHYLLNYDSALPEEELIRILSQIADALDYAHHKKGREQVVIHRGIKLNNILVGTSENNKPNVYLSDFGLSSIIGPGFVLSRTYKALAEGLGLSQLSYSGYKDKYDPSLDSQKLSSLHESFMQTFAFLAPEQKKKNSDQITPAADVYAFGILVYYLITRSFPEGVFDMPSLVCPEYRNNWDLLVCHCLQVNPDKRPSSLVQAMDKLLKEKKSLLTPQKVIVEKASNTISSKPVSQDLVNSLESKLNNLNSSSKETEKVLAEPLSDPVVAVKPSFSSSEADTYPSGNLQPVIQKREIDRPTYEANPEAVFNKDTTVTYYQPKPQEVKDVQPLDTEVVVVQGGVFERGSQDGSRDEMPIHQIRLNSFAIDIHPVTNEQFVRFLEAMGGEKDAQNNDIIRLRESRIKRSGGKLSIESGYSKHPVVGVTWYGAVAYAKWVGKRLPYEGEWEIAAKGNMASSLYPTGKDIEKHQANFFSSDTTAVMSYPPNPYGLYDMAGNVYEWCQDWYGYNYYETSAQEPDNPKGPLQGVYRVLRGGCWKSLKEDLRCAHRHRNNPGTENRTYGFRCATDVK